MKGEDPKPAARHLVDLRQLVDRIPALVSCWDPDLRCYFVNRAYADWYGRDPASLMGIHLRELIGDDLLNQNLPLIREVLRGKPQTFERVIPDTTGAPRNAIIHYEPEITDGRVTGYLVQITEVTSLRHLEESLRREQAARSQLQHYAERLDTLLHEREEMLDVLAHEVRQPLHNALATLGSAKDTLVRAGQPGASARLAKTQELIGEVLAEVDNSLAVAVLLARQEPIVRADTDIDTLVAVAIGDMPESQRDRIVIDRATTTRTASMDMSLMRLALRNLLANALKFSPPDSRVTLRLMDSDTPLALLIDVADSGPGVEAALLPQLFQRGARASDRDAPPGHGLGLYIVQRIMEMHGGWVGLVRNTTRGATMRLVVEQAGAD